MRRIYSLILLWWLSLAVLAGNPQTSNPALRPEMAERNYMLQMVEDTGNKGNDYEQYVRRCNDRGICRFSLPVETVIYETEFSRHKVIYPGNRPDWD